MSRFPSRSWPPREPPQKAGVATFDSPCIPTDLALLELGNYKAFLANRRELIAKRLNAFLGTTPPRQ